MALPPEPMLLMPSPPARATAVRGVRSTFVTSGFDVLRERQLFDRYLSAMPAQHRGTVGGLTAGVWLPTEFMLAHYAAWDSLDLSAEDVRSIGRENSSRVSDTVLRSIKYIAGSVGATPWTVVSQYSRLWPRAFDGGGVRVEQLGPKEASFRFVEIPFARSAYFRGSLLALHENGLSLFATKLYARVVAGSVTPTALELRLSWV